LRLSILRKVLEDYEKFLKKRPGDRHAREQMADAKRQLGELFLQVGNMSEARPLAVQAVEEYEGLLRETPQVRGLRFGVARARYTLADFQVQSGDPGEGSKEVTRAIELVERLKAEEPGNGDYSFALARNYELRAEAGGQQGHIDSGLADNTRVLEILAEGAASMGTGVSQFEQRGSSVLRIPTLGDHYGAAGVRTTTGSALDMPWPAMLLFGHSSTNQGILLSLSGRLGEAARVLELAIMVHDRLREGDSRKGSFRHGLALALLHSGHVQVQLGLPERAEQTLRKALELMRQLVWDDPVVKEYRATRLLAAGYLGESLFRQGRMAAAAELLREAEQEGEEVLGGSRHNRGESRQHVWVLHVLGCLECDSGNPDRGLALCRKAHEKLEQSLRETPGHRSLRSDWLTNREALARCRFRKGGLTRAGWIAEQQQILAERKDLVGQDPPLPRFQEEFAGSAAVLASLLLEAGRPAEALACVDGVLPDLEKAVQTEQDRVKTAANERQEAEPLPDNPNKQ
jgi:tetratricopeptide (TPR) repeat protein